MNRDHVRAPDPGSHYQPPPSRAPEARASAERVVAPDPTPAGERPAFEMPTREQLEAFVAEHEALCEQFAGERDAHDLARKMLFERGEQLAVAQSALEAAGARVAALEAEIAQTRGERDTLKTALDTLEAQLTAPASEPAAEGEVASSKPPKKR